MSRHRRQQRKRAGRASVRSMWQRWCKAYAESESVQRSLNNHMRNMALWGVSVIKPDGHVDALTPEQAEALQQQSHPTADALFGIFGMRRVEVQVENQRTPSSPSAGTGPAHCQPTPKDEGASKAQ